jgi:hypothetical protein
VPCKDDARKEGPPGALLPLAGTNQVWGNTALERRAMSGNVRIAFLALALVLCTLASMAPPASALAIKLCGPEKSCEFQADCAGYCQPCGYQYTGCFYPTRGPVGFCGCL